MAEVPWPAEPLDASISWPKNHPYGFLRFYGPDGEKAIIHVTKGETYKDELAPVWHVDVGHSPNPVTFRKVQRVW